jgi:hypothetical protein
MATVTSFPIVTTPIGDIAVLYDKVQDIPVLQQSQALSNLSEGNVTWTGLHRFEGGEDTGPAAVFGGSVGWLQFDDDENPKIDLISSGGVFTIRVDGEFPAPFTIDSNNHNRVTIQNVHSEPDDYAVLLVNRVADHTGGTPGNLCAAAIFKNTVSAGNGNYEAVAVFEMDSYAIATDPGNHSAVYMKARKFDAGMIWSWASDTEDHTVDPTTPSIGGEVLIRTNGTDDNGMRCVLNVAGGQLDKDGDQAVFERAIWITAQYDGSYADVLFKRGLSFGEGNYTDLIGRDIDQPTAVNGVNFSGIAFSGNAFSSPNFAVTGTGDVGANAFAVADAGAFYWATRSHVRSPSDGYIDFFNSSETGFVMVRFGGGGNDKPALKVNLAALESKLADDSGYTQHNAATFALVDGVTAPSQTSGFAKIYVDSADGDLKVKFGDGVVKVIASDT